ncbi:MAG: hypothetical protein ACUVUP_06995 [Thermaceae bacterium]
MRRIYPAHKVTPLLVQDPELMALWKEAAQEGRLKAETRGKENVVVVEDSAIIGRLEALGLSGQKE